MQQRIVIIGSGFAGLWSALSARRLITLHQKENPETPDIEVVVIAPQARLVMRPRLYEADPASMTAPLEDLFQATGVTFVQGIVESIRPEKAEVVSVDNAGVKSTLSYTRLILAAGSTLKHPNIPGVDRYTFNIDQVEAATELDAHIKGLASLTPSAARNTVVICGGGFTGIELAAELPARLRSSLGPDASIRVVLVEQGIDVGPDLGPNPRPVIVRALSELGVETKLAAAVTAVDRDSILLSMGERIETLTAVWTAGVVANSLTQQIPSAKDKFGRLHVDSHLRTLDFPEILATGDTACAATDDDGHDTLMSCQHAMPLGTAAGHNAAADLLQVNRITYRQPFYGTCLDLGAFGAVVGEGWQRTVKYQGLEAKPLKQFINSALIYPPEADAVAAFAGADPAISGNIAAREIYWEMMNKAH